MSSEFHTTHWSVVLTAKGDDTAAKAALRTLCETYYQPILHYVERAAVTDHPQVYGGRDAADLTHDFFARLLEGNMFEQTRREGAPFRSYLLGAVKHFLSQLRIRESAEKRGRDFSQTALPDQIASVDTSLNDAVFDRDWAEAMISRARQAMLALRQASEDAPETTVTHLLPWVTQEMNAGSRTKLAAELGMTDVAIKVALHRLRKKFRETIRTQIAETVKDASEINAELDHLIRALQG